MALTTTANYHGGEPLFVRLVDSDQNRDATVRDSVDVQIAAQQTGDRETIRLIETAPASGVFVGYLQTRQLAGYAGRLHVAGGARCDAQPRAMSTARCD